MEAITDREELEKILEERDRLSADDIRHLTAHDIFLALIEPKSFSYPELLKVFNEELSDEALKQNVFGQNDVSLEAIKELRKDTFLELERLFENREISFSSTAAVLAAIDGRLYDFIHFCYFDYSSYYINQAVSFSSILPIDDWWFVDYEEESLVALALSDDGMEIVQEFIELNYTDIDAKAEEKVLRLVKGER